MEAAGAGDTGAAVLADLEEAPLEDVRSVEGGEAARLLLAAEADLLARRLTSPVGNNAWERYQRVLELDPANAAATAGMERVLGTYGAWFEAALAEGDFVKAEGYLAKVEALHAESPLLESGRRRLAEAERVRAEREAEAARVREESDAWLKAERANTIAGYESYRALSVATEERKAEAAGRIAALEEAERVRREAEAQRLVGEMVLIPGGSFQMGDLRGGGDDDDEPVRRVTVPAFRLGKHEVTVGQFRRFVTETGYNVGNSCWIHGGGKWEERRGRSWRSPGFSQTDADPVVCVSWYDAQAFIRWLNGKTGGGYRLPAESEWEYAARAGTRTKYHFGNSISSGQANFDESGHGKTVPVGSYSANGWGLHDMHGNVWEWVQDCWNDSYRGAPGDGSAWESGNCGERVVRGGSWDDTAGNLRSADRGRFTRAIPPLLPGVPSGPGRVGRRRGVRGQAQACCGGGSLLSFFFFPLCPARSAGPISIF